MRTTETVRGFDIAGDIRFHGEHSKDEEAVERIKDLSNFLFDIFEQVEIAENQVKGRQEMSAEKIDTEIRRMKELLKEEFFEEWEVE